MRVSRSPRAGSQAALPTPLFGSWFLIAEWARMSPGAGLLCEALAAMSVVGLRIMVACGLFRNQLREFEDSQAERCRNPTALALVEESLVRPSDRVSVS